MKTERRQRYRRARIPPPIQIPLGHTDHRIVTAIAEMRFLTTAQVQRLLFAPTNKRYCQKRLMLLFHNEFLDRVPLNIPYSFGATRVVHCLWKKGADHVAATQKIDVPALQWQPRDNTKLSELEHNLAINDFWIEVIRACRRHSFDLDWIPERELKHAKTRDYVTDPKRGSKIAVVPDGYFTIGEIPSEKGNFSSSFAVEVDRGTMEKPRWQRKIRGYIQWVKTGTYQKRYKTKSLRILIVVHSAREIREWEMRNKRRMDEERRERYRQKRLQKLKEWTEYAGGKGRFWFATIGLLQEHDLFYGPVWQKGGVAAKKGLLNLTPVFRDKL